MSKTKDRQNADVRRLIPGEPIPEFGGLTPEQLGDFATMLETTVMTVARSGGAILTLYAHLATRILMDIEDAAGPEAVEEAINQLNVSVRDELGNQRKFRALEAARAAQALKDADDGGSVH